MMNYYLEYAKLCSMVERFHFQMLGSWIWYTLTTAIQLMHKKAN